MIHCCRKLLTGTGRSEKAVKNIFVSFLAKGISILCSLAIVPITINYINSTQYGIWLSLSSVIAWVAYFDLGLGNGFRNKFAETVAKGDVGLARSYVSTSYITLSVMMIAIYALAVVINLFVDWSSFLKVDASYANELSSCFLIVTAFFCLNMVANLFSTILTANQQPGISAMLSSCGQVISLVVIILLSRFSTGKLTNLALFYSGIPCLVMFVASILFFCFSEYRGFSPSCRHFRRDLIPVILGKGVQFFVICLAAVAIFQIGNIVVSREVGPEAVTQYNVATKYFTILSMAMMIIITPYWSAFTNAYALKDFTWMKSTIRRLEKVWVLSLVVAFAMLAAGPLFFRIWLGDSVYVPASLSITVCLYVCSRTIGDIYMYMINGIGKIRLQLYAYILLALFAWPLMVLSCRLWGVSGISVFPAAASLIMAVLCRAQLYRIVNGTATGILLK